MKDIQQLIQSQGQLAGQEQPRQHQGQQDFAKQVINQVFRTLRLIYPSSFAHSFRDETVLDATKRMWIQAFVENQIDSEQKIRRGFERARASDGEFMPSVGKFIHWCTVEPEDGSFERFLGRDLRNFAERHTSCLVGYECRTRLEAAKAKALWYKTLAETKQKIQSGELQETAPERQTSIESPKQNYDNNQMDRVIDEMLAKGHRRAIRGSLKRRLMERVEAGELEI